MQLCSILTQDLRPQLLLPREGHQWAKSLSTPGSVFKTVDKDSLRLYLIQQPKYLLYCLLLAFEIGPSFLEHTWIKLDLNLQTYACLWSWVLVLQVWATTPDTQILSKHQNECLELKKYSKIYMKSWCIASETLPIPEPPNREPVQMSTWRPRHLQHKFTKSGYLYKRPQGSPTGRRSLSTLLALKTKKNKANESSWSRVQPLMVAELI